MSAAKHTEKRFEDAIEAVLISHDGGYVKGNPKAFDRERGIFPDDLIAFVKATQAKRWEVLETQHGDKAAEILLNSLTKEIATKGLLQVLRQGFKCYGKTYRASAFKPGSSMNPEALAAYGANTLSLTRQVKFNPNSEQSIDVVLSVNGLPVVTLELKNPITGQTCEHARHQYDNDRDPRHALFKFKTGALVHFAVDPDLVYMTTRLKGKETFWLPFNRGNNFRAGNPLDRGEYKTGYLWNSVLARDSLMDILAKFVHLEVKEREVRTTNGTKRVRKETMIFPRYHQLDVVRELVAHAGAHGSGHNYLVQHSAGSGKSNSIAWLAHRLSNLHDADNEKIFHTVVVITDRRVLDQQLQDTIFQFDHKRGVVQRIDDNTQQLARALSEGVPIVISTVQKFPFIAQALDTLEKKGKGVEIDTEGKRFAVIVDEAHSSAAGETAQELRRVLNRSGIEAAIAAQILDTEEDAGLSDEARASMLRKMSMRPRQPNLSYFAFTATPKFKTKALFDEPGQDGTSPFHHYSMRQAIEEGFILDVLANYTTYDAYFELIKVVENDPEVPKRKAAKALARFLAMHPHNLRQKVEVIVEHFRRVTRHKIGGRAKAMVVTGSRESAVRYKLELDKYIKEKGYTDVRSLVAFSGSIELDDAPGKTYTEVSMNNGISEKALPVEFATDAYQVLIVAEKYQTGFDQPLLHTMYVDKRLAGVQAVQTLSRLNRTAPGKDDCFVLDFVNKREEIYDAFKPYYEQTEMGEMPDPHRLYGIQNSIIASPVIDPEDVDVFCEIWFAGLRDREAGRSAHRTLNAIIDKAVARYEALEDDGKEEFKAQLVSFRNLYIFLSQIIPYQDSDLEKLHTYGRFLLLKLPMRGDGGAYALENEVKLKFYRLQKRSEGAIDLSDGEADPLKGPTEVGTGGFSEEPQVPLSSLIDRLNDHFGTDFTQADQLFFDQIVESAKNDDNLQTAAQVNSPKDFEYVFARLVEGLMVDRMEGNEAIFDRYASDSDFQGVVFPYLAKRVFEQLNAEKKKVE